MIRPLQMALAFSVLTLAPPAFATTRHVPADYPTIQGGIDAATYGDTVLVACGTYYEHSIVVNSGVVLRSETGYSACVTIDGGDPQFGGTLLTCPGDSTTVVEGFTLTHGVGDGEGGGMHCSGSPVVRRCRFSNNYATFPSVSALSVEAIASPRFFDCEFDGEGGEDGAISLSGTASRFQRCSFTNCNANNAAGGAVGGSGTFVDCYFGQNSAEVGAGAIDGGIIALVNCVFVDNVAGLDGHSNFGGGAVSASQLTAIGCTFYGNWASTLGPYTPEGATIQAYSGLIKNCIVVGSPCGEECGTVIEGGPGLLIECTNIWHPTENAWAGGIGTQLGQNGNISVDPIFCNAPDGDFHLSSISPCLGTLCGTMGAFGLGCYDHKPGIISISDVGNDQGRQVRLTWYRANDDFAGNPFDGYAIYRRQDLYAAAPDAIQASGRGPFAIPGWDYITTVPDRGDDVYQAIVPTLCDSTITSGQCWSAFFVSALTPTAFYDSPVDSGYSKDNLPPPTPTSFAVSYNTGSGNHLIWDAVAASDFAGFRVYRGATPRFVPSTATLVHATTQTTWNDPAYDGWGVFYEVTAFDMAGNESDPANAGATTGVHGLATPKTFALFQNVPNPFNPTTRIAYDVPEKGGDVSLRIYDVEGRLVATLVEGAQPAGEKTATWDGRADGGSAVSSGVYFYRLRAGKFVDTKKMVLLK